MIEILTAASLILACVGLLLGALLRQGTPTPRGRKFERVLNGAVMASWVAIVAVFALMVAR
jgi:hypothetical protein